ncbi:MAG TPA: NADP-dependent phosphogluconate dehydrogenase, partial [Chloroflexota bacterium]|nr:NADP-dependent phosphogluconate dehydrogenase [Chloroflexota bacterium]
WSSQDAMELDIPVPTIDAAVSMRNLSSLEPERVEASRLLTGPPLRYDGDRSGLLAQMREALHAAMIITYAQGMAHLRAASEEYGYGLNLEDVARIWRGGCIVRSALLEPIMSAFAAYPEIPNLLVAPELSKQVTDRQPALRSVVMAATQMGLPVPGMMASLGYFDGYRSDCLPANLVQAQRDYFGAHSYERVDAKGSFHTHWE